MDTSAKTSWRLSGNAPVAWEKYLVPSCVEPFASNLVERVGLSRGERVLDAGCGTGIVARLAAPRVRWRGKVVGLDLNAAMLEVARQASQFIHPPIEWKEGDLTKMPVPDASFDVVLCQFTVQFLPDRQAALREMHRVLAPGGRLAFNVFRGIEHNPGWVPLADALEKHVSREAGDIFRSIFAMRDGDELRSIASGAGFRDVRIESHVETSRYPSFAEFVRFELESMPTPALWQEFEKAQEPITRDVAAALASYADDDGVSFPANVWVVDAVK
jgi:ubiquinone/menaquinone biosynthesis C-methylase UbiE